jgi:hypothetical protein
MTEIKEGFERRERKNMKEIEYLKDQNTNYQKQLETMKFNHSVEIDQLIEKNQNLTYFDKESKTLPIPPQTVEFKSLKSFDLLRGPNFLNLPVKNPLSDIPEISKNEAKATEFQLDLIDLMLSDYSEALLDLCIEYDGV